VRLRWALWEGEEEAKAEAAMTDLPPLPPCHCRKCLAAADYRFPIFVVCATCGAKRCPKATDHELACTGSNEPGQPGSAYEHCKPRG